MRKLARILLVSACAVGLAAIAAYAADQTILGRFFSVKAELGGPTKTKVSALEKNSNDTLVGDPTATGSAGGAILQIFVNGGTPSSQSFVLNQGANSRGKPFWSGDAVKGFKYSDSRGEQSAVKSLSIALKPGGTFRIKATISSKNGPLSIVPPDPGTSACVAVRLGVNGTSGDRYSAQFGPESELTNKDATLFRATKPRNEGECPSGVPAAHLYWTNAGDGTIVEADLDGSNQTTIATGQSTPFGVAVGSSHLYWANEGNSTIVEANLDGSDPKTIATTGRNGPQGVAVDSSHLYWSNPGDQTIVEANLDGTGQQTIATGQFFSRGVAVDASHLYWANVGDGTIIEANLDGSNQTTIATGQNGPTGVAVGP
jgi:uncharacterized protein DUF5050